MNINNLAIGDNYAQYSLYILGTVCLVILLNNIIKVIQLIGRYRSQSGYFKNFAGPKPHWLFGNLRDIPRGKNYVNRKKWAETYGPLYTIHVGPYLRQVTVADPEAIRIVLNHADPKDPFGYGFIKQWLGDGLLISNGKKWSRNRRLLTPSFHFDILKPYQKIFSNSAKVMMKKWRKHLEVNPAESVEMFECVSLMTLDSLMKCIFGIDQDFQEEMQEQHPYIKTVYELSDLISKRFRNVLHISDTIYYLSSNGRKFRKAVRFAQEFSKSLINSKREEKKRQNGGNTSQPLSARKYVDFLDTLLDCRDEDGNGMTNQEIQDEVDTFLFEGHDTTASGISWCLHLLAKNPGHQQRCRDEINSVLGDKEELEWEDIGKLSYLSMCIKESLRLRNPVGAIGRLTANPITFPDGRQLPANSWVTIDINTCHHNPKVWPEPEKFDPDRFLPENSKGRHSHAFVGFSAGPRNCIGQHFALNEMKTVMSLLLKNFYFDLDPTKPADPYLSLILRSSDGIWLKLKPIQA